MENIALLVSVLERSRAIGYTCTEIYFKELAHTTMWAAKSDIGRAGQQARDPQKS